MVYCRLYVTHLRRAFSIVICLLTGIYIFLDEAEEEDPNKREAENKEYIEETNRDAIMIAAAKLVATEVVFKVCTV